MSANHKRAEEPSLPTRKKTLFFFVMILSPFLLLALLEVSLRIIGYGPNLALFTTEQLAGNTYHVMNHEVKRRYFSRVPFNPSTSPDFFSDPKPEGTFRIFCLGGSTTVGYPYWYNGSFSSFLRDRMSRLFPDRTLEIINVGMTATNSFTVVDMAKDLLAYEPDLLIVYDGHNEFYGALGVASNESAGNARWMAKLYLKLIHFKSFLALQDIVGFATGFFSSDELTHTGMTMMERLAKGQLVPRGGELHTAGLEAFKANLHDLLMMTGEKNIPVLLGAQVSNLRDLPPFVPVDSSSADRQLLEQIGTGLLDGERLFALGEFEKALNTFRQVLAIAPLRPDVHFNLARCLDTLGRYSEAEAHYLTARDFDLLRFRTDSDLNKAMQEIAGQYKHATFVDMEDVYRRHSPHGLIGNALLVEHLHPNSQGFFLMGKAYADAMQSRGIFAPPLEWAQRDTLSDEVLWYDRSVTELDEIIANRRTAILTSGWPFKNQVPLVDAIANNDTLGQIAERVTKAEWNWEQAHNAAAEYYWQRGEKAKAAREYSVIINQLPLLKVEPYLKLARILLDAGQYEGAYEVLRSSLKVEPTLLAYRALGDLAMRSSNPGAAMHYYQRTLALDTNPAMQVENGYLLATAFVEAGDVQKARTQLLNVLRLRPDYQPAVALLAQLGAAP